MEVVKYEIFVYLRKQSFELSNRRKWQSKRIQQKYDKTNFIYSNNIYLTFFFIH